MKKILIINAHQYYPFSEGKLTKALIERMERQLSGKGYEIKHSNIMTEYNPLEEVEKHVWADVVIMQSPVNWMGLPWMAKKYVDEVYSAGGLTGKLGAGDGRSPENPKYNYGSGGSLKGKKYMLSLTFNAPKEAFNAPDELFRGKSVDDLWFPQHMNFRFFAMEPLETFVCYDVKKNPEIENDFKRLAAHLDKLF